MSNLSDQFSNLNLTEVVMVCELQEHIFSLTQSSLSSTVKYISKSIFSDSNERIVQLVSNIFNAIKLRPSSTSLYAHLTKELVALSCPDNKFSYIRTVILNPFPSVTYPSFDRFAFLNECLKLKFIDESSLIPLIKTNYEKYSHTFLPWKYSLVWFMPVILRNDSNIFQAMYLELKESVCDIKNPLPIKNVSEIASSSEENQNSNINQSVQYIHKQNDAPQPNMHSKSYESVKYPLKKEETESNENIEAKPPEVDSAHGNIPVKPIPHSVSNQEPSKKDEKSTISFNINNQPNLSSITLNTNANSNQNDDHKDLKKSRSYSILNPVSNTYPKDEDDQEFKKQFSNPTRELADFMESVNYLKRNDWDLYNTMVSNTYVPESLPAILKEDRVHDLAKMIERYNKNEKKRIREIELNHTATMEYEYDYEYEEEEEDEDSNDNNNQKTNEKKGKMVLVKFSENNDDYEYESSSSSSAKESAADLSKNIDLNPGEKDDPDTYSIRFQSSTGSTEKFSLQNSFIQKKEEKDEKNENQIISNQSEPSSILANENVNESQNVSLNNNNNSNSAEAQNSNSQKNSPETNNDEKPAVTENNRQITAPDQSEAQTIISQAPDDQSHSDSDTSSTEGRTAIKFTPRRRVASEIINIMESTQDVRPPPTPSSNTQSTETDSTSETETSVSAESQSRLSLAKKRTESDIINIMESKEASKLVARPAGPNDNFSESIFATATTETQSENSLANNISESGRKKKKVRRLKNRQQAPKFVGFNLNQRITSTVFEKNNFLRNGPTLVQFAAFYGSVLCVIELVKRGADLTIPDLAHKKSAMFAIAGGDMKIIEIFEYEKVDFTATPQIAAYFMRQEAFNRLMSTERFSLSQVDLHYASVLHQAAASNNIRMMIYCIENGVDVNIKNVKKMTPLHFASYNGQLDAVLLLSAHKEIEVNAKSDDGMTPLMIAAKHGFTAIVETLLSCQKIDVNAADNKGLTATHLAVLSNYIDVVRLLVKHDGIDLAIKDGNQRTAADLAKLGGFNECAQLIAEHMKSECIVA